MRADLCRVKMGGYAKNVRPGGIRGTPNPAFPRSVVREFLAPVARRQEAHGIPSTRIFVGEFGVRRRHQGAEAYLSDLIDAFEERGWH